MEKLERRFLFLKIIKKKNSLNVEIEINFEKVRECSFYDEVRRRNSIFYVFIFSFFMKVLGTCIIIHNVEFKSLQYAFNLVDVFQSVPETVQRKSEKKVILSNGTCSSLYAYRYTVTSTDLSKKNNS